MVGRDKNEKKANAQQSTQQKTKDWATRTQLNTDMNSDAPVG